MVLMLWMLTAARPSARLAGEGPHLPQLLADRVLLHRHRGGGLLRAFRRQHSGRRRRGSAPGLHDHLLRAHSRELVS